MRLSVCECVCAFLHDRSQRTFANFSSRRFRDRERERNERTFIIARCRQSGGEFFLFFFSTISHQCLLGRQTTWGNTTWNGEFLRRYRCFSLSLYCVDVFPQLVANTATAAATKSSTRTFTFIQPAVIDQSPPVRRCHGVSSPSWHDTNPTTSRSSAEEREEEKRKRRERKKIPLTSMNAARIYLSRLRISSFRLRHILLTTW